MTDITTITMITCPYCDKEWVREDTELVCSNCIPSLNVDLAAASLVSAINDLSKEEVKVIAARKDILLSAHVKFTTLMKKVGNKDVATT